MLDNRHLAKYSMSSSKINIQINIRVLNDPIFMEHTWQAINIQLISVSDFLLAI